MPLKTAAGGVGSLPKLFCRIVDTHGHIRLHGCSSIFLLHTTGPTKSMTIDKANKLWNRNESPREDLHLSDHLQEVVSFFTTFLQIQSK
jgi:hypothetical protein